MISAYDVENFSDQNLAKHPVTWYIKEKQKGAALMNMQMFDEFVHGILNLMQTKLHCIVLYGSTARGTDTAESDIDIALIMDGRLDSDLEDQLSDFVVDMNLKYDKVFSVIDIDSSHMAKWRKAIPFYQNIEQEGVVLWTAA